MANNNTTGTPKFRRRYAGCYVSTDGRWLIEKTESGGEWRLLEISYSKFVPMYGAEQGTEIEEYEETCWWSTCGTKRDAILDAAYYASENPVWERTNTDNDHLLPRWAREKLGM